jgi:very-short-patch-repair endonuclease
LFLQKGYEVVGASFAGNPWDAVFGSLKPSLARCVFAKSIDGALEVLRERAAYQPQEPPIVLLTWPDAPRIDQAIEDVARQLANAVLATYPQVDAAPTLGSHEPMRRSGNSAVDAKWLRDVHTLADAGRVPLPAGYPVAESFRRFAGAFSATSLICLLVIEEGTKHRPSHVDGLCRGAQWIALQTSAKVALLLNDEFRGDPALSSIDFDALTLHQDLTRDETAPDVSDGNGREPWFGRQKLRLWPLLGQPHPFSKGEQLLSAALSAHDYLAGRFIFNSVVETDSGKRYIVDLLERELRLVIEVDGFSHHSSCAAFTADRERDYRLLVDGYLVLRLPHHEVIQNVDACVIKIETLVKFRESHRPNRQQESTR